MRGYFGIGIYHPKHEVNVGTLWRSAYQLGASFVFTIGQRYSKQASDTPKVWRHIPLMEYSSWDDFREHIPYNCMPIAIEVGGHRLSNFVHPERAIYIPGAEDHGLPEEVRQVCTQTISIESVRLQSFNVSMAGSIVMYDRLIKNGPKELA